jgi:hypothetical protein
MPGVYHTNAARTAQPPGTAGSVLPLAGRDLIAVMRPVASLCCDPLDAGMRVKLNTIASTEGL